MQWLFRHRDFHMVTKLLDLGADVNLSTGEIQPRCSRDTAENAPEM